MSGLVDADMHYEQLWFVIEQRNELAAALQLAKDMMIANDLNLINTFEVIDKALLKVKDWEGDL
jgi:hypothetical protein